METTMWFILLVLVVVTFILNQIFFKQHIASVKNDLSNLFDEMITSRIVDNIFAVPINHSINPLVKRLYREFMVNSDKFHIKGYYITTPIGSIWAANSVNNRRFEDLTTAIIAQYGDANTINRNLSLADQTILDAIVKRVSASDKAFIKQIFIE